MPVVKLKQWIPPYCRCSFGCMTMSSMNNVTGDLKQRKQFETWSL